MTIASAITAAQGRVADAYTAVSNKGGTLPATQNLTNLPTAIDSIPTSQVTPWTQPVLTANGTIGGDSFAVAMDSQHLSLYAWYAFDGITTYDRNKQAHTQNGQPHWIEFYNPEPIIVTKMTVYNGGANVCPLDWQFQCSDDDTTWTTVASGTNTVYTAGGMWSFNVPNSGAHQYYRFYTTSGYGRDSGYLGISEFVIEAHYEPIVPTGTLNITTNGLYNVYGYAGASVAVYGAEIPSYIINSGVASRNSLILSGTEFGTITEIGANGLDSAFVHCNFTGVLDFSNLTTVGDSGLSSTFRYCAGITGVDFSNLTSVAGSGFASAFYYGSSGLTSVSFPSLTTVGSSGFSQAFTQCTALETASFASLSDITASFALTMAFSYCTALTNVYFNSLTTTSFGSQYTNQFNNMLSGTGTRATHTLHFPSNLESTIQGLSGYPNFGGSSGYVTLAFDLPATS